MVDKARAIQRYYANFPVDEAVTLTKLVYVYVEFLSPHRSSVHTRVSFREGLSLMGEVESRFRPVTPPPKRSPHLDAP